MERTANPFEAITERFERLEGLAQKILANQETEEDKNDQYFTIEEYCTRYKVTRPTVNKRMNEGILTRYRIGGRVLILKAQAEQVLIDSTKDERF